MEIRDGKGASERGRMLSCDAGGSGGAEGGSNDVDDDAAEDDAVDGNDDADDECGEAAPRRRRICGTDASA